MPVVLTIDQLADLYRKAFDHICDPADWKAPIDCEVPWEVANIYMQAIEFMTGVKPTSGYVTGYPAKARLVCKGYRNGPCGG